MSVVSPRKIRRNVGWNSNMGGNNSFRKDAIDMTTFTARSYIEPGIAPLGGFSTIVRNDVLNPLDSALRAFGCCRRVAHEMPPWGGAVGLDPWLDDCLSLIAFSTFVLSMVIKANVFSRTRSNSTCIFSFICCWVP